MKVLSFDPSTVDTGYALIDDGTLLKYGNIQPEGKLDLGQRLISIHRQVRSLMVVYSPDIIVCEDQYSGQNPRTGMTLREVLAMIRIAATDLEIPFVLYAPNTVKKSVAGDGRASKGKVQDAVMKQFDTLDRKANDNVTDAIAVGLTHFNKQS